MAAFCSLRAGFLAQNVYRTHFSKAARLNQLYAAFFHSSPNLNAEGLPLKMPSLSPTMTEGTIVKWLKNEGDPIQPGDALCDIQTDKAVVTMDTEEEGTLAKILIPDDTKDIKVGTLIAVLAPEGEDWKTIEIPAGEDAMPGDTADTAAAPAGATAAATSSQDHGNYGPSVRLLLEQYGLTASQIPPGGPHGILVKGDVLKFIKEKALQPQPVATVPPPQAPKAPAAPVPSAAPSAPPPPPIAGVSEDGYEDVEVTSMRRTIAKRLTQSKSGIAHAYGTLQCRSDKLLELRKKYKAEGINVSVNDLIIKAVSVALTKCPEMNCVWQGDQLAHASQVDISIAVATPTGLITPIVRNADSIGIEEIASKVRDLATRARENKLKLDEFQGGTFTISNLGMFGISEFSAIINPPQCGILAVGSGIVSIDETGSPVTNMRATLSYDRAGVDDDTAAAFLETLKSILEEPSTMLVGGYKSQVDHPLAALL